MSYSWGNNYNKEYQLARYENAKQDQYNRHYRHFGMSTFAEVEQAYNSIKPIRGRRASQDLRPLGYRQRTWERVIKFDDNTYGLYDGFGVSQDFGVEKFKSSMPILWERKPDGEYVTIQSHWNGSTSISRYNFLSVHLPKGVTFWWQSGKHFVTMNGTDYALPKSRAKMDYSNGTFEWVQHNTIVLKREGTGFIRVNDLLPVATKRKSEEAKQFDKPIKEFIKWMEFILPVLGDTLTWQNIDEYAMKFNDGRHWYWQNNVKPEDVKAMLTDDEHDTRLAFAVCLANTTEAINQGRFDPERLNRKRVRDIIRRIGKMYDFDYK